MKKSANDIDRHVGSRLRMRRMLIKMSQEKLGEALGLTFQQVQKYEKGTNRIGASRLQHIAQILGVTPSYFFDGTPGSTALTTTGFANSDDSSMLVSFLGSAEGLLLTRAFVRIKDQRVRRRVIDLVAVLADPDQDKAPDADALPSQT